MIAKLTIKKEEYREKQNDIHMDTTQDSIYSHTVHDPSSVSDEKIDTSNEHKGVQRSTDSLPEITPANDILKSNESIHSVSVVPISTEEDNLNIFDDVQQIMDKEEYNVTENISPPLDILPNTNNEINQNDLLPNEYKDIIMYLDQQSIDNESDITILDNYTQQMFHDGSENMHNIENNIWYITNYIHVDYYYQQIIDSSVYTAILYYSQLCWNITNIIIETNFGYEI